LGTTVDEPARLILASNRGPLSLVRGKGQVRIERGSGGGLVGLLDSAARSLGERATWVAVTAAEADWETLIAGGTERLGYRLQMVHVDPAVYARYYHTVANRMLWFALHDLWGEVGAASFGQEEIEAWRHAYDTVNRRLAETVARIGENVEATLFQDYHLTTAPRWLRELRPRQPIGHFTHAAFRGPEGLACLPSPVRRWILEGMLEADLLGFHTPAWSTGFMRFCEREGYEVDWAASVVEHAGRTWVREYPAPIDVDDVRRRATSERAEWWYEHFRSDHRRRLLVRTDRMEPSKNILRSIEAFGALLDRRPDFRGTSRFVLSLYQSRSSLVEYRRYAEQIHALVAALNGRHPGSVELYTEDDQDRSFGALRAYDVLVVNSIRDGMNVVAKEGPAVNQRSGVLVLSRGAGSLADLGATAVVLDDCFDVEETALGLERALDMRQAERDRRARALRATVGERSPADWIRSQAADLCAIQRHGEPETPAASTRPEVSG
jgi:trehalose 6-phosphate synthase